MEYIKCENCPNKGKLNTVDGTPICEHCENRFYQTSSEDKKDD